MEKSPFCRKVKSCGEFMAKGRTATVLGAAPAAGQMIPSIKIKTMHPTDAANRLNLKVTLLQYRASGVRLGDAKPDPRTSFNHFGSYISRHYISTLCIRQPF